VDGVLYLNGSLPKSAPAKNNRGVNLISDALPFGRLWYSGRNATSNAIRLVFLIETQPTDHGAPNRNAELGGLGMRRFYFFFLRRVPFIRVTHLKSLQT
jgi:hypothetical protein